MMDDLEQMIKERLLQDLIDKMSDQNGERLKPKEMAVQVAAPDKGKLAEGLDKAKDVLSSVPGDSDQDDGRASSSPSEEDDEQRLMELLGEDDHDDEDDDSGFPGKR